MHYQSSDVANTFLSQRNKDFKKSKSTNSTPPAITFSTEKMYNREGTLAQFSMYVAEENLDIDGKNVSKQSLN